MKNRQKLIQAALIIITAIALMISGYFYYTVRTLNQTFISAKAKEDLISKVGRLYLLPQEDPTVATVSDPKALGNQTLFASSQKGDKVLIFANAGKVILYRPSIDKIIDTAPIAPKESSVASPTESSPKKQ